MTRDQTLIVLVLLALWWMSRKQPIGDVHATIYGASVAPGVDVTEGGSIPGPDIPYDFDPDEYEYE